MATETQEGMVRVVAAKCAECGYEGKAFSWLALGIPHQPLPVIVPARALREVGHGFCEKCGGMALFATEPVR